MSPVLATTIPISLAYLPLLGGGLLVMALVSRDLKRFAVYLMVGGWGTFAVFSPSSQFPQILRPIAVTILTVGAVLHAYLSGPIRVPFARRITLPSRLLFVYLIFVAIGCVASPYGPHNLIRWIQGVQLVLSAFYAVSIALTDQLLIATFLAGCLNVILSVQGGQQELDWMGQPDGRLAGHMNPNHLAFTAAEVLLGVLYLYPRHLYFNMPFHGRTSLRIPLIAIALVSAYAMYASESRTGLLGFLVAAIIAWLVGDHRPGRRVRIAAAVLSVALVVSPLLLPAVGGYLNRDKSESSITSLTGRTDFWPLAVDLIRERPVVGWGVNVITSPVGYKFQKVLTGVSQAHNAFLEAALQAGLIGAISWALSLLGAMIGSFRLSRGDKYRFLLISMSILLVLSSVTESSPAWFGDMFIAYVLVLAVYSERVQLQPRSLAARHDEPLVAA